MNDDLLTQFGSIRFDLIRQGKEELETLTPEEITDVKKVAAHIPGMLEIAAYYIREKKYPA